MSQKSNSVFTHFSDKGCVLALAFVGGFVDAAGYMKLLGLFTSSITGNLVVACASLFRPEGVLCRSLVCITFAVGGGLLCTLSLRLRMVEKVGKRPLAMILFACEAIVILISLIVGEIYVKEINSATNLNNWAVMLLGSIMGLSMGIHNAAAKEVIPNCPSTTVMTMTIVSVSANASAAINYFLAKYSLFRLVPYGEDIKPHLEEYKQKSAETLKKFKTATKPLISFLVGALVGAALMHEISFYCLFVPTFVVVGFIVDLIAGEYNFNLFTYVRQVCSGNNSSNSNNKENDSSKSSNKSNTNNEYRNIELGLVNSADSSNAVVSNARQAGEQQQQDEEEKNYDSTNLLNQQQLSNTKEASEKNANCDALLRERTFTEMDKVDVV